MKVIDKNDNSHNDGSSSNDDNYVKDYGDNYRDSYSTHHEIYDDNNDNDDDNSDNSAQTVNVELLCIYTLKVFRFKQSFCSIF